MSHSLRRDLVSLCDLTKRRLRIVLLICARSLGLENKTISYVAPKGLHE